MRSLPKERLDDAVERIVDAMDPTAVYLYGSYAYGEPDEDSDIDLLVIVEEADDPPHRRAARAYRALRGTGLPVEVKVVTRDEFERQSAWSSSVEHDVKDKGVALYPGTAG